MLRGPVKPGRLQAMNRYTLTTFITILAKTIRDRVRDPLVPKGVHGLFGSRRQFALGKIYAAASKKLVLLPLNLTSINLRA